MTTVAMDNVLIGTCSWADKGLIDAGTFYPSRSQSAAERLRFYASQFPLVEVDSTYYGLPTPEVSSLWAACTPERFIFDVKSFRLFTRHWTERGAFPKDLQPELPPLKAGRRGYYYDGLPPELVDELWLRFRQGLEPLQQSGKLGLVLLQFPSWFEPERRSYDHILRAQEKLAGVPLAVEFRNRAWLSGSQQQQSLDFLRRQGLSFVAVDEPQGFDSSLPPLVEATAPLSYVRFHGRNSGAWEQSGNSASVRFDWYYTREEFCEWLPRLRALSAASQAVHALINTNRHDQGPVNARLLASLLGLPLSGPPAAGADEVQSTFL